MDFSVGDGSDISARVAGEHAALAESLGFSHFTLVDQTDLDRDVYVMMAAAALSTTKIKVGQGVTVPWTRHPTVTACATASANELSGGRVFLGIGAGGVFFGGYTPGRQAAEF